MKIAKSQKIIRGAFERITFFVQRLRNSLQRGKSKEKLAAGDTFLKKATQPQMPEHTEIEESKFSTTPRRMPERRPISKDLPFGYGEGRIVAQVRDPWWIHTYWELTQQIKDRLRESLGGQYHQASWTLRVYDVSFIIFNGNNAHSHFDISVNPDVGNWYIQVSSGRSFCIDLGLKLADGSFVTVLRSNFVMTPLDGPSGIRDEEWLIPDDLFKRLYGLSFGVGSSPGKGIKQIREERFVSSPGFASMASPVKVQQRQRQFWLVVNTELIVYGATEPDANVTVSGRQIKLNKDGTFSLRFALPDGRQIIPVRAESKDGIDVRLITPVVTKESK